MKDHITQQTYYTIRCHRNNWHLHPLGSSQHARGTPYASYQEAEQAMYQLNQQADVRRNHHAKPKSKGGRKSE